MKVLVVGGGAREHALCWKLRQSPLLTELYCAPGNPGIARIADAVPIAAEEIARLADFAVDLKIDLTVIGPELSLTLGVVDEFRRRGLKIFGPTALAAEIEGSKVFAKEFMARHGIPTAPFRIVSLRAEAKAAALEFGLPVVLKADGLAAGKGVLLPTNAEELERALDLFFDEKRFGRSGDRVVVEAFLTGEEVSCMALCDGERLLPLVPAKDYKRLGEGDTGPNTGGMGSHSPAGVLDADLHATILERVLRPAVAGMSLENRPFVGVLYAGIMLTEQGPMALEFNARLGDPEAQVLLMRLEDDLLPILASAVEGGFTVPRLSFRREAAACFVLASEGYPESPVKGEPIVGVEAVSREEGVQVFHASTGVRDGVLVANGGRVLSVCALGSSLRDALRRAYAAQSRIEWPSKILRRDIGRAVLERLEK
jgi:phosphoribosylamine---glycine ligase